MSLSKLDLFYRRLILTKFYTRGWGKPEELREILALHGKLSNRQACSEYVESLGDVDVKVGQYTQGNGYAVADGVMKSPVCDLLPDSMPVECRNAYFQLVLPSERQGGKSQSTPLKKISTDLNLKPMCIHMAGTGDHGFSRRRELLAKPLLSHGISSLLLENPYYGVRKPKEQTRSGLLQVKDLFIMGLCLILESQVLLKWLEKEGYGPLGMTGISMGGHMASLAATNSPKPIALIPCMSWTSASVVWTEGVLSKAIPWRVLESQYAKDPKYETQINELIKYNMVNSYELGKDYVKDKGAVKLSSTASNNKDLKITKKTVSDNETRRQQTLLFMKGVMDQVTDVRNFSIPVDPELVTFVIAKADAYYPIHKLKPMNEIWPGCEVRYLDTGHIAGFLMHHRDFCLAITDTFERLIYKYHINTSDTGTEISKETAKSEIDSLKAVEVSKDSSDVEAKNDANGPSFFRTLKVFTIKS